MQIKWKIREGTPEDRDGIIQCRQITFPGEDLEKQEFSYWKWEFIDNYAGPTKIFVACDNNKIVGHYAFIPQHFILNHKLLLGSIVVDVMTHPDYRYQKMFTSLGHYAIDHCSTKTNLEFTTGYPIRPEVLPGHLKVGWNARFKIPLWVLPLSIEKILSQKISFLKNRPSIARMVDIIPSGIFRLVSSLLLLHKKKYQVEITDQMSHHDYQPFWGEFLKQLPADCIIQERTLEYLQWRYESNPLRKYKYCLAYDDSNCLVGVMVTRELPFQGVDIMVIVDAWAIKKDASKIFRHLFSKAREICHKKRYSMIAMMLTKNSPILKSPLRFGFIPTPFRFTLITREFKKNSTIQSNKLKWHLMWGDTDDV